MELYAMHPDALAAYLEATANATAEERAAAEARFGTAKRPNVLDVSEDGTVALINIVGQLSPKGPSPLARFFGYEGTAYSDITEAAQLIQDDPAVKDVRLVMNTPGGSVSGLDAARQALAAMAAQKNVVAENHGLVASAGYWLATAANRIEAKGATALTGSIGIVIGGLDTTGAMERAGVKRVRILSKNAPNKQPDPATERGLAQLQAEADALERIFLADVAAGRGTTVENVAANFGRGGVLVAADPDPNEPDALSVGMIDAVNGSGIAGGEAGGLAAGPTTFEDLPIVDRPWDSAAAVQRVRRFLDSTDTPGNRYRRAFFWYDSENAENFGAYKLPFTDVVDGELVAIWRGITAANGAMSGARGQRVDLPSADRPRVQAHINRYRAKWDRMQQNDGGNAIGGGCGGAPEAKAAEGGGQTEEIHTMDLSNLKAEHPALYKEAVAVGVAQERERAEAHVTMGEASGDLSLALACIKDGSELSASIQAKYLAAGMNKSAQNDRGAEAEGAIEAPEGETAAAEAETEKAVASVLAEKLGVQTDA